MKEENKTPFFEEEMLLEMGSNIKKAGFHIEVLREALGDLEVNRGELLRVYQLLRYRAQLNIWQNRGLVRCTKCFELGPSEEKQGKIGTDLGFGLVSKEEASYILLKYISHRAAIRHKGYTHKVYEAHCLCPACYYNMQGLSDLIKNRSMVDLDETRINKILEEPDFLDRGSKKIVSILKCEPRIFWHNLPIPERAYEIGEEF